MGGLIDSTSTSAPMPSSAFPQNDKNKRPQPVLDANVVAAAKRSNAIDDAPDSAFRNTGSEATLGYDAGDISGAQSHAIASALARKDIKDLLPGGTDLLVDKLKKMVRN
jgi:hypothetical protein